MTGATLLTYSLSGCDISAMQVGISVSRTISPPPIRSNVNENGATYVAHGWRSQTVEGTDEYKMVARTGRTATYIWTSRRVHLEQNKTGSREVDSVGL